MAAKRRRDDYQRKRDFARTPEPRGARTRRRRGPPVFVVHRHDARRLHWDLRLEVGGALASWAVPRGFSYDPKDKRLAVRTEDHPLAYEDFEGVIPEGQYGAGTMEIWDRGTYRCVDRHHAPADAAESIARGELKIVLEGRRLRGEWHLVETKGDERSWLVFKSRDRYAASAELRAVDMDLRAARPSALPKRPVPLEVAGERASFSDPDWLFEAELEGVRALAIVDDGAVAWRGLGRMREPELDAAVAEVRARRAVLDGIVVAPDADGRPSRAALAEGRPRQYYAWDLLHFDGLDLRDLPLAERKAALGRVLPRSRTLLFAEHVAGDGERLCASAAGAGLHGVIAKPAAGRYRAGEHGWLRIPLAPRAAIRPRERGAAPDSARATISNPGKVFWPDQGYTKADLCDYYAAVAAALLPHLVGRPVHMHRFPDGIEGESFYQHQPGPGAPDWLRTVAIESSDGACAPHVVCDDLRALLWFCNNASIDLHPWMSRVGSLDHPDWLVLDLDPKGAPFADVVTIARAAHELLAAIGLASFAKTSGKSGLHVYVPLAPGHGYDQARLFAEGVARVLAREHASIATVERQVQRRGRRVYLDFGQNRRGQTVVAPYVARPVPGATVSTPLAWDELGPGLDPRAFTIKSVPRRVARVGDLFAGVLTVAQELAPAIAALDRRVEAARRGRR